MKPREVQDREDYINRACVEENKLMEKIATELKKDQKEIQLDPYEGKILSLLVKMKKPQVVVEIGTLYGYSLSWILEGLGPEAKVWSVEKSEDNYAKSISFLNEHYKKSQVQMVRSNGLDFLEAWSPDRQIDFLFIDADKGNYLNYLNLAKKYLSPGAVVVGDNTFLFGHAAQEEPPEKYSKNTWASMREFNKVLSGSTGEFEGLIFPTYQGMTVGIKK